MTKKEELNGTKFTKHDHLGIKKQLKMDIEKDMNMSHHWFIDFCFQNDVLF